MFVDEMPSHEAVERKGPIQFMRDTVCNRVGHDPARTGRSLETTCSPPAIDKQIFDWRQSNDWRCIRCNINDTTPGPENLRTGENRKQFNRRGQLVFDHM